MADPTESALSSADALALSATTDGNIGTIFCTRHAADYSETDYQKEAIYNRILILPNRLRVVKDGTLTYGGGRFLSARLPDGKNKQVELDFNRAYNPPCAFTAFATCPVPRKENRLGVRVEAGERLYEGGH